jgi:hypothetical protein
MFDWLSSRWVAALRLTRSTGFRTALVALMLVGLFNSSPSADFPNCNCGTLWDLCNSGQNNQSCDVWDSYCNVSGYCDCMDKFGDANWCQQFCGATFCVCTTCPGDIQVDGGGSTQVGNPLWLTAYAYDQNGGDHSSEGSWSWWVENGSVGWVSGFDDTAIFYPQAEGTTEVFASFSSEACGGIAGSTGVSVTNPPPGSNCPCGTPLSQWEWNDISSIFPGLVSSDVSKLGEATSAYNCLAWAGGITSRWVWTEVDYNHNGHVDGDELNRFYQSIGASNITFYGYSWDDIQHAARNGGGCGGGCPGSSKLGSNILMAHDIDQLSGGPVYGSIVGGR